MKLKKVMAACAWSLSASSAFIAPAVIAQNISGKVVNYNDQAIAGAIVSIAQTNRQVLTDKAGNFLFEDIAKGSVELHISAKKYSHYTEHLMVGDEDVSNVEFSLSPTVMEIIDVHATPLHSSSIESALPVNVLSSDELRLKQASTLGETLKNEVGVHSTYYGPVASSPIIRGLDGPRVMVTQNGLDVGDASRVGPDHVVSSETSTATQIEVLRGPATLFYGSGAIGGVVNVVDNRVPTSADAQFDYMLKHNDVADENEASFNLNTGINQYAFHLDSFWRESNDYEIPGDAALEVQHEEAEHDEHAHEEDEHESHENYGKLANSASKSSGFTVGASYLLENGYIGMSYGHMDRQYGIPGHQHGDEHTDENIDEESIDVKGDLDQSRIQLLSDLSFDDDFINQISTKFAYTDYQHQEIEGGEVGTQFKNNMSEARVDLHHKAMTGWKGAWTLHFKKSDFEAIGEEAFTPPSISQTLAAAWLEEKHFGDLLIQLGSRIERVEIKANDLIAVHDEEHEHENEDNEIAYKHTFTPISASIGAVWDYQQGYNLGMSLAVSQRAPSAAELFANGPHIGTNTFEVGALYEVHQEGEEIHIEGAEHQADLETSYSVDLTWRKFDGDFGFVISSFYNHIDDYYYQQNTGFFAEVHQEHEEEEHDSIEEESGLPIYVYRQGNVDLYGAEIELIYQISAPIKMTLFADYIRAKLTDGGNLPRIPPMRIGSEITYQGDSFASSVSINHYFKQNDVAALETKTKGYSIIDANVNYYIDGIGSDFVLFAKANNLTNEEARVHSSFLKNDAPLPGRGFSIGIRGSF